MSNKDLLDIPEFLKRQSDSDSVETEVKQPVKEELKPEVVEEAKEPEKPKKPTIQERMQRRFLAIMGDIHDAFEEVWDRNGDPMKFKVYDYFAKEEIPGAFMKMIIEDVNLVLDEERKALEWRVIPVSERTELQQDYVESFENYSKKEMETHIAWWERIIKDCEIYKIQKLKERKPRKYKAPSKEKLAKKVKYKEKDDEVKLTSVSPVLIIGAHGLIVYNSKTRKLGLYEATHKHHGLTVRGTTILNYDNETSVQKTLRKPVEVLEKVHTGGIQAFKNTLNSVKSTDVKLTGRLNADTVLVRVFN